MPCPLSESARSNDPTHRPTICGILCICSIAAPSAKSRRIRTANSEFPFCSERCKLLDLGAWASEKYVISEPAIDDTLFEDLDHSPKDEHKN